MRFPSIISVVCASLLFVFTSFSQDYSGSAVKIVPVESSQPEQAPLIADEPVVAIEKPEPRFPAPKKEGEPLTNVLEIVAAFLSETDWREVVPLVYKGDLLKAEIEAFYDGRDEFGEYQAKLFQMELDPKYGGPFWVLNIFKGNLKDSKGFPIIVRKEAEYLKVDWRSFSEFVDREFVSFIDGRKRGPAEFCVVVEPLENYTGPDRDGFAGLSSYDCYKLFPPYGDYEEFTEYAFVQKGSATANELSKRFNNIESALAMVLELNIKSFNHGIRHSMITDVVTEGWLDDPEAEIKK